MEATGARTAVARSSVASGASAAGAGGGFGAVLGMSRPYLVGVGGAGMSALGRLLADSGVPVRGSDSTPSPVTESLAGAGIGVDLDERSEVLPEDSDGLVISAAIRPDHGQVLEAERRGLPVLGYAEALGRCQSVRTGVSIAGTHGKSTTTAMLGCCLTDAGLDPAVIVGATCGQLARGCLETPKPGRGSVRGTSVGAPGVGSRLGSPKIPVGSLAGRPGLLLAEACEFNRSFLHHRPSMASIANLEADHLDVYGSLDAVVEAFAGFASLLPGEGDGGYLLVGHDGAHRREVTAGLGARVETIGFAPGADWRVKITRGLIAMDGPDGVRLRWSLSMPGEHNAMNSAVAAAMAVVAGADPSMVGRSLSAFEGLDRRLQRVGRRIVRDGHVVVYDDYGHHPTEIDLTLRALRDHLRPEDEGGRLVVVFQPHQHSRTRFLLDEFAQSFGQADVVIVPHIYFVRDSEAEKQRVSSADLVDRLRAKGVQAMHLYPFEAIVEQLQNVCRAGDVLVVMGAGPVWTVARDYLAAGRSRDARG